MSLDRWTPLTLLWPERYLDDERPWEEFDLLAWSSSEYEWTQDAWNGFRDVAKSPRETVALGRGDCEDYALVAASWAVDTGRSGVGLGVCWEWPYPWPTHVVAYDDERVYSSGETPRTSLEEWLQGSRYDYVLRRPIT